MIDVLCGFYLGLLYKPAQLWLAEVYPKLLKSIEINQSSSKTMALCLASGNM